MRTKGMPLASALEHCAILDGLGFSRYVVSMKDSDWRKVVEGNRRFADKRRKGIGFGNRGGFVGIG